MHCHLDLSLLSKRGLSTRCKLKVTLSKNQLKDSETCANPIKVQIRMEPMVAKTRATEK